MLRELCANGCYLLLPYLAIEPSQILTALGARVPVRGKTPHRDLLIHTKHSAPRESMSAKIGAAEQPMHTDAAYNPCPPRYIVFQCLELGETCCATNVMVLDPDRLSKDRPEALAKTIWVAHGGGRPPFYCPVMDVRRGEFRIRFDPLCMRPIHGSADAIGGALEILGRYSRQVSFEWELGSILIVDNWRCLHARGQGGHGAPSRRLRRWSIGADHGLVI
jgi:hypothetical protein